MRVAVIILEPPGQQFGRLRHTFREEVPDDWKVRLVSSSEELIAAVGDRSEHHLVILPDGSGEGESSGLALIGRVRQISQETPIVVMAEQGDVDLVARAIAAGATDFLVHGEHLDRRIATLLGKLSGLFEVIDRNRRLDEHNAQLRESIQARLKIVGQSPQVKAMLDQIRRVAQIPRPVLIVGERGTGKELVARAIHFSAESDSRPIVTVNCAAFNDTLLESELFGHEKGAFTGADATRYGKFEQADEGTLFLDEIGQMSVPFQEKILRVVEYGTFTRVGGTRELTTSARVIAATNRDLREKIGEGTFLPDLYDRLTFETIEVPPLRQRSGDIRILAQHFLDQFARETSAFDGKVLSTEAITALSDYTFPGNVRELKNIIERAVYRDTTSQITPDDLGLHSHDGLSGRGGTFHEKMNALGRRLVTGALNQANGNQAQAARDLGLSYHQFRYYLKKYG